MTDNALHSSESNDWGTPPEVIELLRQLWPEGTDLDPASSPEFNKTIGARRIFTAPEPYVVVRKPRAIVQSVVSSLDFLNADQVEAAPEEEPALPPPDLGGLGREWDSDRIFLNAPGGSLKSVTGEEPWLRRYKQAVSERFGTDSHAVAFWCKLVESWTARPKAEAFMVGFSLEIIQSSQSCRLGGVSSYSLCFPRKRLRFSGATSPTHGNVLVYMGSRTKQFEKLFRSLGEVKL